MANASLTRSSSTPSAEAFLALPLHDRIAAIISGTLTFVTDDDVVVAQAEALRAISQRQRKPS
jgi:hypothetical protein